MAIEQEYFSLKRNAGEFFDWSTFLITILLMAVGLISIYSATSEAGMSSFFNKQLVYAGIGTGIMFGIMFIPERWIYDNAYIIYGLSIVLLILVLIFGREINHTRGWLAIAGFTIQPAEFAKLTTLIVIARYLSQKGKEVNSIQGLGYISMLILIPGILIMRQPDHGTTTVLVAMLIGVLFWSGFDMLVLLTIVVIPFILIFSLMGTVYFVSSVSVFALIAGSLRKKIWITATVVILVAGVGYSGKVIIDRLEPYQKERIETFLNPGSNPKGSGYNVIQSIMAVGSGGFTGKGFMAGTQTQLKYIPEQWTDFIFSVPTEEFGFVGGFLVVFLLASLILRAVKIATESDSKFYSIICFGIASIIFYHTFINVGMAIGLMPVMGIPLPFMSSGGSALILNLASVGIMLNSFRAHRLKKFV